MDEKLRLYIEKTCETLVLAIFNCDVRHKREGSISGEGKWIGYQNGNCQIIYFPDKKTVVIESYPDREYIRFSYNDDKVEIGYRPKNSGTILQQLTRQTNITISEYKDLSKYKDAISAFIMRAINKFEIKPYSSCRVSINKILSKESCYMMNVLKSINETSKNDIIRGNITIRIYHDKKICVYENGALICDYDINYDSITWYKSGCGTGDVNYIDNFLIRFSSEFE